MKRKVPNFDFNRRQKILWNTLRNRNIDALVIFQPQSVSYFTGYAGIGCCLLFQNGSCSLFVDQAHYEEALFTADCQEVVTISKDFIDELKSRILYLGLKTVGYLARSMSADIYLSFKSDLQPVRLIPLDDLIDDFRSIKDKNEIRSITMACKISDNVLGGLVKSTPWICRESTLSAEISSQIVRAGAKEAFPNQVTSGSRTSRPHGQTTTKKLSDGELVMCDIGVSWNGYCSDCTRTFIRGKKSARKKHLYKAMTTILTKIVAAIKPGVFCNDLFNYSIELMDGFHLADFFCHVLGHGVGLEVHESPVISGDNRSELKQGMILAVEPGIYIPGWGGIRLEDLVMVTRNGVKVLTKFDRDSLIKI